MSFQKHISATQFSDQDDTLLHKRVVTILKFDSKKPRLGVVVRADKQSPFLTIIKLDDDRSLLTTNAVLNLHLKQMVNQNNLYITEVNINGNCRI